MSVMFWDSRVNAFQFHSASWIVTYLKYMVISGYCSTSHSDEFIFQH